MTRGRREPILEWHPWRRTTIILVNLLVIPVSAVAVQLYLSSPPVNGGCGEHAGLVIAADTDISYGHQRRAEVETANATMPGTRAAMVELGPAIDAQHSQLVASQQARSCAYDILVLDTPWTSEFASRGFLAPVPSWLTAEMTRENDFFVPSLEAGRWQDRQYSVPWTADAGMLFSRGGRKPPADWDALLAEGYAAQLDDYEGLTVNALEVIWNTGEKPVLNGTVRPLSEEDAKRIKQGLDRLSRAAGSGDWVSRSRSWNEIDSQDAFAEGEADRLRNWPRVAKVLAGDSRVADDFTVGPLPAPSRSVLGGQSLAVSKFSKRPDQAWQLIRNLTGREAERRLFWCGGVAPTRRSALEPAARLTWVEDEATCAAQPLDDVPQDSREERRRVFEAEMDRQQAFAGPLEEALTGAQSRPITPHYGQFSRSFRSCANAALNGAVPEAPVLRKVINDALRGRQAGC